MKMPDLWRPLAAVLLGAALAGSAWAQAREAPPTAEDPVLEKKVMAISAELRCLVCQNQTIADSHAGLAVDLRNQVREMLRQGKTQAEIVTYMTDRYGDFVMYRPPVKATTMLLWFGPAVLLGGALIGLVVVLRRRARLPDDHFEPEPDAAAAPDDPHAPAHRTAP